MAGRSPRSQATRIVGIKVKGTFEENMRKKNQRRLRNVNQIKKRIYDQFMALGMHVYQFLKCARKNENE